jgi:hypothetical protein
LSIWIVRDSTDPRSGQKTDDAQLAALIIVGAGTAFRVVAEHDERRHVAERFRHIIGAERPAAALDIDEGAHLVGMLADEVEPVGPRLRMHEHDRGPDLVEERVR